MRVIYAHLWTNFEPWEIDFWRKVSNALELRGYNLVISAAINPPEGVFSNFIRFPASLAEVPQILAEHELAHSRLEEIDVTARECLEIENNWAGVANDNEISQIRLGSLGFLSYFYQNIINTIQPCVALIWNGHHSCEYILRKTCEKKGVPYLFLERGPLPGTLFMDSEGISTDSSFSKNFSACATKNKSKTGYAKNYDPDKFTWWAQPNKKEENFNWRDRLKIPVDSSVVLFAGQVHNDTQRFLFSHLFETNLEALTWLASSLPDDGSVFILGKHHPKATSSIDQYKSALKGKGVWLDDISLSEALQLADYVAAVNSSVLYEGMLLGKPCFCLGKTLASGWNCFYELKNTQNTEEINNWLRKEKIAEKKINFDSFCSALIEQSLYSYHPLTNEKAGDILKFIEEILKNEKNYSAYQSYEFPFLSCLYNGIVNIEEQKSSIYKDLVSTRENLTSNFITAIRILSISKSIAIWGAGSSGRAALDILTSLGVDVLFFIDSDIKKQEKTINGLKVFSPYRLSKESINEVQIVIASEYSGEIFNFLEKELNYKNSLLFPIHLTKRA